MTTELQYHAEKAALFILRHHPQAKEWADLAGWCAWYISNGFMASIRDENHRIIALAAGRPLNDPQDGNIPYKFTRDGSCVFIDFLAIEKDADPQVYEALAAACRERFGEREQVAFQRVSTHDYNHFLRHIGREKRIGVNYVKS
jgi:hypothetical protein